MCLSLCPSAGFVSFCVLLCNCLHLSYMSLLCSLFLLTWFKSWNLMVCVPLKMFMHYTYIYIYIDIHICIYTHVYTYLYTCVRWENPVMFTEMQFKDAVADLWAA